MCSLILSIIAVITTTACSGDGSEPAPTSASLSALEAYFEQYCASAREVIREQRAISTPAPGDPDDMRPFVEANDRVLADWLRQEAQVAPPQPAATAHAELLDAIRAVATTAPARMQGSDDAAARLAAARDTLFRIAADARISAAQCLG